MKIPQILKNVSNSRVVFVVYFQLNACLLLNEAIRHKYGKQKQNVVREG